MTQTLLLLALTAFSFARPVYATEVLEDSDLIELGIQPDQPVAIEAMPTDAVFQTPSGQPEEVRENQLKLAGRGFVNKQTGESMALACVGVTEGTDERNCDSIRMVYFNPASGKAYYIGQTYEIRFEVPPKKARRMDADQQRQYAIKHLMKNFKKWRNRQGGMSENTKQAIQGGAFMGVLLMEAAASSVTGGAAIVITVAIYPFYLVLTPIITGDIKLMNGNGRIVSASYDRNGWNWSASPGRIRPKVFNLLLNYFGGSDSIRAGAIR